MLTSPQEVKRKEEGGGEESIWRKEAECKETSSPTPWGRTDQLIPPVTRVPTRSFSGPSTSDPATYSFLASSHDPQPPQASGQNSSHSCSHCKERKAKTCWQLGAEGLPGSWDKWWRGDHDYCTSQFSTHSRLQSTSSAL